MTSVVLCVLAIVAVAAAMPELAVGRFGLAAAPIGDQVIFCGGFLSNTFQPSALCEVLGADDSIRSGQFWTGTQRGYLAAASTNNIALFGGGGFGLWRTSCFLRLTHSRLQSG